MMDPARIPVVPGQDDPVAAHLVDLADMLAVRALDFHMLGYPAELLALALALRAEFAELLLELGLMLAPIILIIPVELVELTASPFRVMGIVKAAGEDRRRARRAVAPK